MYRRKALRALAVAGLLSVALASGGCSRSDAEPPDSYAHFWDRWKARLPLLGTPCENRELQDCYRFKPPRRMRGDWYWFWEESNFTDATDPPPKNLEELLKAPGTRLDVSSLHRRIEYGTYEIEFIGRKTALPGRFEGNRPSNRVYLVVVDKLISIKPVKAKH